MRKLILLLLDEYGGDAPPAYELEDRTSPAYVTDALLMNDFGSMLRQCDLSLTTFIEERIDESRTPRGKR